MTPDQLVEKWDKEIHAHPIPTWTTKEELAYLAETASQYDLGVELGSFHGVSAAAMLAANPALHLWCCDHWQAYAWNREVCAYFLRKHIADSRCELITGDSKKAAEMLSHMKGQIGFVFVDDGHEEWQVKQDIEQFYPLLKSGGRLVGHDFNEPHNNVALGVIKSGIPYTRPVGSLWQMIKP